MSWSDPNTRALWMEARLEAYLDGDLPAEEAARFEQELAEDASWHAALDLARQIQGALHTLPTPACPPALTHAVLAETRHRTRRAHMYGWRERLTRSWAGTWQPALAMTALLLMVVVAALVGRPAPTPAPTAEVEQAMTQVKWTLAYLSELGRQTGEAVRHDALEAGVVSPVQQAFSRLDGKNRAEEEPRPRR